MNSQQTSHWAGHGTSTLSNMKMKYRVISGFGCNILTSMIHVNPPPLWARSPHCRWSSACRQVLRPSSAGFSCSYREVESKESTTSGHCPCCPHLSNSTRYDPRSNGVSQNCSIWAQRMVLTGSERATLGSAIQCATTTSRCHYLLLSS